jgi:hypothetical protein
VEHDGWLAAMIVVANVIVWFLSSLINQHPTNCSTPTGALLQAADAAIGMPVLISRSENA